MVVNESLEKKTPPPGLRSATAFYALDCAAVRQGKPLVGAAVIRSAKLLSLDVVNKRLVGPLQGASRRWRSLN
jgi:hypothetical protein